MLDRLSQIQGLVVTAGVLVGVYLLWRAYSTVARGVTAVVDPLAQSTADFYVNRNAVKVLNAVRLPSGAVVPLQDIVEAGSYVDGSGSFEFGGRKYRIVERGPDGVYRAELLQ